LVVLFDDNKSHATNFVAAFRLSLEVDAAKLLNGAGEHFMAHKKSQLWKPNRMSQWNLTQTQLQGNSI
jgi:hypothetical protein